MHVDCSFVSWWSRGIMSPFSPWESFPYRRRRRRERRHFTAMKELRRPTGGNSNEHACSRSRHTWWSIHALLKNKQFQSTVLCHTFLFIFKKSEENFKHGHIHRETEWHWPSTKKKKSSVAHSIETHSSLDWVSRSKNIDSTLEIAAYPLHRRMQSERSRARKGKKEPTDSQELWMDPLPSEHLRFYPSLVRWMIDWTHLLPLEHIEIEKKRSVTLCLSSLSTNNDELIEFSLSFYIIGLLLTLMQCQTMCPHSSLSCSVPYQRWFRLFYR